MIKILDDNIENLYDCRYGDEFLDTVPKIWTTKNKIDKLDSLKLKTSALQTTLSKEWEDKSEARRNICKKHIW